MQDVAKELHLDWHAVKDLNPSLSFGTTTPNGINNLGRIGGAYGTTFV